MYLDISKYSWVAASLSSHFCQRNSHHFYSSTEVFTIFDGCDQDMFLSHLQLETVSEIAPRTLLSLEQVLN
jgi:hypothetical protein